MARETGAERTQASGAPGEGSTRREVRPWRGAAGSGLAAPRRAVQPEAGVFNQAKSRGAAARAQTATAQTATAQTAARKPAKTRDIRTLLPTQDSRRG